MIIEGLSSDPMERKFLARVIDPEEIENFLSVGACSYFSKSTIYFDKLPESGAYHPGHILVGCFSSFAGDVDFTIGFNHIHKGSTSTFPFTETGRIQYIAAFGRETPLPFTQPKDRRASENRFQVIIGHDVWVGQNARILGGVKIGNGAIIGANSVVAKDIPPYVVAVGNPARVVKQRFDAETTKKLLAVKWWNWPLEKVLANGKYMKDAEKFLQLHWSPELEDIAQDEIGQAVESFRAQGFNVYNFVADFRAIQPLWLRIIAGFCQSNYENTKLVIWLDKDSTDADFNALNEAVNLFGNDAGKNILVVDGKISPHALRSATHFITTREMSTLECLDWLWNTDVKIVSALDEGFFDGEPPVDWKNLYH